MGHSNFETLSLLSLLSLNKRYVMTQRDNDLSILRLLQSSL